MAVRDYADQFSKDVSEMSKEEIYDYFEKLKTRWALPTSKNYETITKFFMEIYNINNFSRVDMDVIQKTKNKLLWECTEIYYRFVCYDDYCTNENNLSWEKIFEVMYYGHRHMQTCYQLERMAFPNYTPHLNEDTCPLTKFSFINYDKNTNYQNLILYLLQCLNGSDKNQLARYNTDLYSKIYTPDGNFTHCWKYEMKIKTFIMKACNKEFNFDQWQNLTSNGNANIKAAEAYLIDYEGPELLVLEKDRHIFSFNNGIWITKYNSGTEEEPYWTDKFIKYSELSSFPELVNSKTVSSNYFNYDFDDFLEMRNQPERVPESFFDTIISRVPTFKMIMDYQKFEPEVQFFMCVFMGRMFYNINELDKLAVCPYLVGKGGAGKSTIIEKIVGKFYQPCDTKCMSNNIEKQFGLKTLSESLVVIAPEIMDNFKMEQTDWQLVVEGGTNTYAEKHKNPETITWNTPVFMGGNRIPGFNNDAGQFSRRLVIWKFWRKIVKTDTRLSEKLARELPVIMKLCCWCYLWMVNNKLGSGKGIYDILPKYFTDNQEEMEENTNPLVGFLKSSNVIVTNGVYIPEKEFKTYYNEYCRENNFTKHKFNSEFYNGPFSDFNIKVERKSRRAYPINSDNFKVGTFYVGVDIAGGAEPEHSDDDP